MPQMNKGGKFIFGNTTSLLRDEFICLQAARVPAGSVLLEKDFLSPPNLVTY